MNTFTSHNSYFRILCLIIDLYFNYLYILFVLCIASLIHSRMLNHLLKRREVQCEIASDGHGALQLVRAAPAKFDVVFVDVMTESPVLVSGVSLQ